MKEMDDKPPDFFPDMNPNGLGWILFGHAYLYIARGKTSHDLGLLLGMSDEEDKKNLSFITSERARGLLELDSAYLAAHMAGDVAQLEKTLSLAKFLSEMNPYSYSGDIYAQADLYYANGKHEYAIGLLLAHPDCERKRSFALQISKDLQTYYPLDYAYISAHIAGDDEQKKRVEQFARQRHQKRMEGATNEVSLRPMIRKIARFNGEDTSNHPLRYAYGKRRAEQEASSGLDKILQTISQFKACARNGNRATIHYYSSLVKTPN